MAIDRCANFFCRTVLVGIYLRNVDEWNTSLHRSRILIRVSARDNRASYLPPLPTPLDRQCLDFFMCWRGAVTANVLF